MSVSIDIVTNSDSLDMFGDADTSSAYSLSGHVTIAVTSPFCLYGRRRTARILLHSVVLTFEGQTETLTPRTGYSAMRLCSVSREISPQEPVEMNNEGHEDSDKPCYWNVVFDIPIPGWLPPTAMYGVEDAGIRYTLFADAKFTFIGENESSSFSLSALCSPFRSRMRTVNAQRHILLRRLVAPYEDANVEGDMVLQPRISYLVKAQAAEGSRFPADVLESLQVLATVPEHINAEHHGFPLTIRMRTRNLRADQCKRVQVASIKADVVQKEKYRSRAPLTYYQNYPLPLPRCQPPEVPLRDPHPLGSVYESGLGAYVGYNASTSRQFSLLPSHETGFHTLGENNYAFAKDAETSPDDRTWYTLETSVPYIHQASSDKGAEWAGPPVIRPSVVSPLVNIEHEAAIELTFTYNLPDSDEVASERLAFSLPLYFQFFAPDPKLSVPPSVHSVAEAPAHPGSPVPSLTSSKPYTSSLPAYSQLFDRNGDRKIDYSVPLPLYCPRASPEASPSSSSLDLSPEYEGEEMLEMNPLLSTRYD